MGGACHGSDPTDPVECGNSQHSPPTSLELDIARLQPVLLISSKFLKLRMSGPMDVHGGSGRAVCVMPVTHQTLWCVETATKALPPKMPVTHQGLLVADESRARVIATTRSIVHELIRL